VDLRCRKLFLGDRDVAGNILFTGKKINQIQMQLALFRRIWSLVAKTEI
jgi:hypothetical protein